MAEKLAEWLKAQDIESTGVLIFAHHDPPWTPIILRRNEALLRVK